VGCAGATTTIAALPLSKPLDVAGVGSAVPAKSRMPAARTTVRFISDLRASGLPL
jgi:hypothetical protein